MSIILLYYVSDYELADLLLSLMSDRVTDVDEFEQSMRSSNEFPFKEPKRRSKKETLKQLCDKAVPPPSFCSYLS